MGIWRVGLSVALLIAFMATYSWMLWDMMHAYYPDRQDMERYLIRMYSFKVIAFSSYLVSNCIMTRSCDTRFENEILLTGLFSIIFISVTTLLHYTHLLIMPSQWNLILFNLTSMAFLLLVHINAKKHGLLDG